MKNQKFEVICLDIRRYSTTLELKKIADENGIVGLDFDVIVKLREHYNKIYIDLEKNQLFAVLNKSGEIETSKFFDDNLKSLEVLKPKEKNLSSDFSDLNLDEILDKISKSGIESLTAREKYFLKKKS